MRRHSLNGPWHGLAERLFIASAAVLCVAVACIGAGSFGVPQAVATLTGDESMAMTGVVNDGSADGGSNDTTDDMTDERSIMPMAILDAPPEEGWLKFYDRSGVEQTALHITIASQTSYRMPSVAGIRHDDHAGAGLTGDADWVAIGWIMQGLTLGAPCEASLGVEVCAISDLGGLAKTNNGENGALTMRRSRPGEVIKAPLANGSGLRWKMWHKSYALYAQQVRYAPNGGTGSMNSTAPDTDGKNLNGTNLADGGIYHHAYATLAQNRYTRPGYRFVGWKARQSGSGTRQPGDRVIVTISREAPGLESAIYDAQWERLVDRTVTTMPATGGVGLAGTGAAGLGFAGVACGSGVMLLYCCTRRRDEEHDDVCSTTDDGLRG